MQVNTYQAGGGWRLQASLKLRETSFVSVFLHARQHIRQMIQCLALQAIHCRLGDIETIRDREDKLAVQKAQAQHISLAVVVFGQHLDCAQEHLVRRLARRCAAFGKSCADQ